MQAWVVAQPGPIDEQPLEHVEPPIPVPGPGEVRIRVSTCGVCRTDLRERHLFQERTLRSVTANTRDDGRMLLETAARIHMDVSATAYPLHEANRALQDLAHDRVSGVAVLVVAEPV